jgi:hypothetical protein
MLRAPSSICTRMQCTVRNGRDGDMDIPWKHAVAAVSPPSGEVEMIKHTVICQGRAAALARFYSYLGRAPLHWATVNCWDVPQMEVVEQVP